MRTLKRIIKTIIWTIVAVYLISVTLVRMPFMQKWLGEKASTIIGKKLGTHVSVGKVYLGLLNRIIIDNLELYDKSNKLMVSTSRVAAKIDYGQLVKDGRIYISSAQIFGFNGTFYKADSHSKPNFQFVLDSLSSKNKSKK